MTAPIIPAKVSAEASIAHTNEKKVIDETRKFVIENVNMPECTSRMEKKEEGFLRKKVTIVFYHFTDGHMIISTVDGDNKIKGKCVPEDKE